MLHSGLLVNVVLCQPDDLIGDIPDLDDETDLTVEPDEDAAADVPDSEHRVVEQDADKVRKCCLRCTVLQWFRTFFIPSAFACCVLCVLVTCLSIPYLLHVPYTRCVRKVTRLGSHKVYTEC